MGKGAQNCLELLKTRWKNLIASNPNEEENLMAAEKSQSGCTKKHYWQFENRKGHTQEAERGIRKRTQRKLSGIIRKAENQNELTTKDVEKNEKSCKNVHSKSNKRISIPATNYNCKMLTKSPLLFLLNLWKYRCFTRHLWKTGQRGQDLSLRLIETYIYFELIYNSSSKWITF